MKITTLVASIGLLVITGVTHAADAAWIEESNRNAQVLLDVQAKYVPEAASANGVLGHEGEVVDLKPGNAERQQADLLAAQHELEARYAKTADPMVRKDLDILVASAKTQRESLELNTRLMVPYFDLGQALFMGFQKLIHEGVPQDRQKQALVRLRRYVGRDSGYTPIAELARQRIAESLQGSSRVAPWSVELQQGLDNQPRYLDGIRDLFAHSGLKGWEGDFKRLTTQMQAYAAWLKSDLLPRARATNQLPEAIYADNLKNFGVYDDPRRIMSEALTAYTQIREEMAVVAGLVAKERGFKSAA